VNSLAQAAALIAGLVHVMIFWLESVAFRRESVYRSFLAGPEDVDALRPWAFNQGFYNLFLAVGSFGGLIALHGGHPAAGRAVTLFCCGCMAGAAVVLVSTNVRMARAALVQGLAPLVALLAVLA
jgi:putative membrane protein